ncbi:MAG: efflux RND transporter permease subunit [Prevotellaceae bacterium]|jgi:multidrug efflux pump|nr:efflux RND transporter permease subunit [Prevotellaceae bacterium]
MSLSSTSIKRPVLATVMTIIIMLLGVIGYTFLGIREYPNVDPPIISVSTSYPGANSDVIESQITEPLEQSINGIPGIRSLSSTSSQGSSRITVEFELNVDMETAANDVRDKVSRAQRQLPRDVDPPTVSKADADANPILVVTLQSEGRSMLDLSEVADLTVKERLQTISGVSAIDIWGEKRYAMRLWLDPERLAANGLTPIDVRNAISSENVELPSGRLEGNTIELTIRTLGLMTTSEEFNNLIIKRNGNQIVRFRDVGRAELDAEDYRRVMKMNGIPMVGLGIIPQPGANHIDIADEVYRRMEQMKKDLPSDIITGVTLDTTYFIRASIKEVQETVYIAFALVILIIFMFLRDWRVTLVPVVAIPVSLIGAFFIMYVAGSSINVLTMLAIVLAVGLVVDDAIVVVENIYVKIERGMSPKEAGLKGSREIFFAVVATTVVLVSVFFPIIFLQGTTGRLFREFSMVTAGSVIISSFVALSFAPMLATKLLKKREKQSWLYRKTEPFFEWLNRVYYNSLNGFLRHRWWALIITACTLFFIVILWNNIRSEMAPLEDRSQISISARGSEGITFEFMSSYIEELRDVVYETVPELKSVITNAWGTSGFLRLELVGLGERQRSQQDMAAALGPQVAKKTNARAFIQQQSTFGGRRGGMPVQYVLQAPNIEKLRETLPVFMSKVYDSEILQMADVNLKFSKPELRIQINRDKAATLGVSTQAIGQTLQLALSGQRLGYFYMNGKQYQIFAEINRQKRNTPLDLRSLYIRNDKGDMIQLDNLVDMKEEVAPPQLYRYDRFVSATVSAGLQAGYTIGDGLDEMDKIAAEVLDDTFRTTLAGESKEFRDSSSSLTFAFILALILIYLVLSAQFESFKDPLIVLFTVPLAVTGALFFLWYFDQTMNIFSQIGIIMLIGLVAKNGILIVEFANQRQNNGLTKKVSILDASAQRLRPILMTSVSTILGLLPLAIASGEGAKGRIAMGLAVIGGMVVSTFLTLYVVPAIYGYIATDRKGTLTNPEEVPEDSSSGE